MRTRDDDGQGDGKDHEQGSGVAGQLGQQVGGSAGSERGLRSLAAEGSGKIGRLACLEQDDADEEETDDHEQRGKDIHQDIHGDRLFCRPKM